MCILGLLIFGHAFLKDFNSLGLSLLAVIGLASLTISAISIFRYPYVSKLTILTFILGLIALIIGGFIGFFGSTYILSLASLIWAGVILIAQFNKQCT
ncbi:hypothetical protein PLUTE_a4994 [Pseudoalteromonas luteoviolacea DSM 6061]|nr:hypothetical protein [Pseudoalteromonas luteoviolacea DSM 6061]